MKKEIITLALAAFALAGNAQILKNDLLKGYKEGDNWRNPFITRRRLRLS